MKVSLENNFTRIILSVLMLSAFFIGLQTVFNAPSAHASDTCGSTGACLGTVAAVSVGSSGTSIGGGGSGPASVGSGGVVSAPSIPNAYKPPLSPGYTYSGSAKIYEIRVYMTVGVMACPVKNVNGFEIRANGAVVTERRNFAGWQSTLGGTVFYPAWTSWNFVSSTCVYPPVSSNVITRTCILSYNATVDRMANSRLGAAGGVGSSNGTVGSVAQLESDGAGACQQNARVALAYNPPNGQNGWGQYQARSNINQVTCRFTTTTFNGSIDNIGKCGAPTTVPGSTARMTIWCDGFTNSWVNKDWTGSDCQNSGSHPLTCTIPTSAKYNGFGGNVQALRDGKDGTLLWGTPQIAGGWGMTNWRSSTVVNNGSTPRNTAVGDNNANQQMFKSSVPFGAGMIAGQNLDQKIAFYKAGDSGAPFSMTRRYLYDAWFTSSHTEIRSIDLRSGNIGIASYNEQTFAVNNKCGPQVSPNIDVIRAIGDTVG